MKTQTDKTYLSSSHDVNSFVLPSLSFFLPIWQVSLVRPGEQPADSKGILAQDALSPITISEATVAN